MSSDFLLWTMVFLHTHTHTNIKIYKLDITLSQVWCLMHVTPTLRKLRRILSSRAGWIT